MDKDKQVEALKHLSQIHREQFQGRKRIEWRCFFTTISFFVFSAVAIYQGRINLDKCQLFILFIVFICLAIITSKYLAHIHIANNKDKELAENAEDTIRCIVREEEDCLSNDLLRFKKYWTSWGTFCSHEGKWGWYWQVITICLFAVSSIFLIFLYDLTSIQ